MQELLDAFTQAASDIQGSAIFSADGIMFASTLAYDESPDEIGAIIAAMQSLGGKTAHLLRRGSLREIHVNGNKGNLIISALSEEFLLVVLTHSHTNIGLLLHEIHRLRNRLSEEGYTTGEMTV